MRPHVHSTIWWGPLRFPHKNDVRFVFICRGSCLMYVICVCSRMVVSNTYWLY